MTIQHQVPDLNVTFSPHTEASEPVKRDIEIRWGLPEDEPRIVELLELNGMHGRPQRLLNARGDSRGQRRSRGRRNNRAGGHLHPDKGRRGHRLGDPQDQGSPEVRKAVTGRATVRAEMATVNTVAPAAPPAELLPNISFRNVVRIHSSHIADWSGERRAFVPTLEIEDVGSFDVPDGKRLVLAIEEDAGVDILHRCGSHARCTTCRIQYLEGEPERMTKAELKVLNKRGLLGEVRLSCQALCDHDMKVRVLMTVTSTGDGIPGTKPEPQITPLPEWVEKPA
jgi:ferredoxin